ncbi:cardiolipin synthase [Aquimarina sp. ERC-38]|uniref:cardiolipin synthase n=1 Tax=Aquimarina sp. ERC-38 TaxID=2949996 RepID=UPI00224532B4|nr:cardiolipin synthase [Aquimarina sp. ERC-38]UZO81095.1 cardiolipin synthase [Aquimarina sp. ERC-38]
MGFIILVTLHVLLILLSLFHIVLYGSRPVKSLSWLLLVILLPFFGVMFYIVFGISRRRSGIFRLKETRKRLAYDKKYRNLDEVEAEDIHLPNAKNEKLARLILNSTSFPVYDGNKVDVLLEGKKTFDIIFQEMEKATHFIHIQYYIFEEGDLLNRVYNICKKKAAEGVEIRILYDAIGSFFLRKKKIKKFRDLGANIYTTMPLHYGSFLFTLNYRNHRKIIIIDGKVGFTGGVNISDKYIRKFSHLGIWDDTHVRLEGPVVGSLHKVFIKDYYFASNYENLCREEYLPRLEKFGDKKVQIVASGPDSIHPSIMQQYLTMINLSEETIYISNPYFIPNSAMLESLRIAALRGVKIKILVPKHSDSWLAKNSMFSFFQEMLSLGIEIYLQETAFLHSKLIIVDNDITSIGSGNFDHRSFEHNFETNAVIYDTTVTERMQKEFLEDCKNGVQLNYDQYQNRKLTQKLSEGIARFFSPLL